jgi:16S rRNA (uracil1498-N3)-methyltransferase
MFWTFVDPAQISGRQVVIDGKRAHHLGRVLRVRVGERGVAVANCREYAVEVVDVGKHRIVAQVHDDHPALGEPLIAVTLLQSILPNPDFDAVVEGATAVGMTRLIAIKAARSISRPGPDRRTRWEAIAESAAAQSHRGRVPDIGGPMDLLAALNQLDERLLVLEPRSATPLSRAASAGPLALAIGPEGGWTEDEHALFSAAGATAVSLGPRILRARLAPIVATAILVAPP